MSKSSKARTTKVSQTSGSTSAQPTSKGEPQHPFTQTIATAATLGAIFSVLAFQELRFEGFEAEKVGLLTIFVAIILGVNVASLLRGYSLKQLRLAGIIRNPLSLAVAALFVVTVLSTLFSLSPSRSIWGAPSRSQGLFTLILYLILFWQASRLDKNLHRVLVPFLLLTAAPICAWDIWLGVTGTYRPGSTVGNPNYLSSWLVMVLLYCTPQVYYQVKRWPRPWQLAQWGMLIAQVTPLLLCIAALAITLSRGALLGFGVGIAFEVTIFWVLANRRRLLVGFAAIAVVSVSYTLINYSAAPQTANLNQQQGIMRLFVLYSEPRINTWAAAVKVLEQESTPLSAANGSFDAWVSLRPFLGYGPETIEQTQSRFGEVMGSSVFIDSFHNLPLDTLITLGWIGLVAQLAVYEAALFLGLRWLGLTGSREWWLSLILQALGALAGAWLIPPLMPQAAPASLIPVSAAIGSVVAVFLWVISGIFRSRATIPTELDTQHIVVIAILSIIIAQWVDNQFAFIQNATQPLWWILLGLLTNIVSRSDNPIQVTSSAPALEADAWYTGASVVGILLLYGMGISIQSRFVNYETGTTATLPVLLCLVLILGITGAVCSASRSKPNLKLGHIGMILVIWMAFFGGKRLLVSVVSDHLDVALSQPIPSANTLGNTLSLLSLNGIMAAVVVAVIITLWVSGKHLQRPNRLQLLGVCLSVILGCALYAMNYTGAILHRTGNGFSTIQQLAPLTAANAAFEAATYYTPNDSRLRIHWVTSLSSMLALDPSKQSQASIRSRIEAQIAAIFRTEPFFTNTQEWKIFRQSYTP